MQVDTENSLTAFEAEITGALTPLRAALQAMVVAIDPAIQRPIELQRTLDIDSKLSWQILNVINEPVALTAVAYVPGDPSLKRLLAAAKKKGVKKPVIDSVQNAVARFNETSRRHAGDRAEFNFMASAASSRAVAESAELEYRRLAYRAESHIWGVSADVLGGTSIVRKAVDGMASDECTIANKTSMRRLKLNAPMSVFAYRNYGAAPIPSARQRLPLNAEAFEQYGAHILPEFCSDPIPIFKTSVRPDGYTSIDVQSREIGRRSSVSLCVGSVFRNCPFAKDVDGSALYQSDMRLSTPARLLVSYLIVHQPSFGGVRPTLSVFRQTPGDDNAAVALSAMQLSPNCEISYQGRGSDAWSAPELPSHREMVQYAFHELGWNPDEFDVFALRMEYPVLHSVVRLSFPVR